MPQRALFCGEIATSTSSTDWYTCSDVSNNGRGLRSNPLISFASLGGRVLAALGQVACHPAKLKLRIRAMTAARKAPYPSEDETH